MINEYNIFSLASTRVEEKKIYECKNNPENSDTTKVSEHIPSVFSMPTISSFKT